MVATTISKAWETLSNFENYGSWNPHLTKMEGDLVMDGILNIRVQIPGRTLNTQARITGLKPDKYLSFNCVLSPGPWWFSLEYVMRLEVVESTSIQVHLELYCYGLRLRFGRNKIKSLYGKGLSRFAWALKTALSKQTD